MLKKMNPNAPEFQPPSTGKPRRCKKGQDTKSSQPKPASLNNLKNAWSNPIQSVLIAQFPKQNPEDTEAKSSLKPDIKGNEPRVMPQPVQPEKLNDESGWATVGKKGKTASNNEPPPESEEDLEVKRQLRRERRKREKEAKKLKKDQEKVKAIRADKDTKVKVVDANLLRRAKGDQQTFSTVAAKPGKLSFFDEEYPTLGKSKVKTEYSTKTSTETFNTDTGSEWETEDEGDEKDKEIVKSTENELKKIEVVEQKSDSKSFSSILKKPMSSNPVIEELSDLISCPPPKVTQIQDLKKVKKKDPITFDIFAALKKKPTIPKPATVLASKLKSSSITTVRNALDSSAPTKRRGKEREKPKKKKPTRMKRLIMSERESRRSERQQNLALSTKENQTPPENEVITGESTKCEPQEKQISQEPTEEESLQIDEPKTIQIPEQTPMEKAKLLLHSRKFRNYCDHDLSNELDETAKCLIQDLVRFQDRQFAKDPIKAKAKKRYVVGLREIKKFLQVRKISILLLAPDVEPVKVKGGLDDVISELISLAKENEVKFSLNYSLFMTAH